MPKESSAGIIVAVMPGHTTFGRMVIRGILEHQKSLSGPHYVSMRSDYAGLSMGSQGYWKLEGLICELWRESQLRQIRRLAVPTVEVSGTFDTMQPPRVSSNNQMVGRLAAEHLIERGLKQFAYYGTPRNVLYSEQRREAFEEELAKHGYTCFTQQPEYNRRAAEFPELRAWLKTLPKPVGLMCANDFRARNAVFACRDVGIRIPEDVAIIGVGNDELVCEVCHIAISSVDIAPVRIGHAAAEMLERMLRGGRAPKQPVLIEPARVITRQSSDILAAENREITAAIRFIEDHAHEPIDVRDVLRAIPISRRALEKNFKAMLGRSPREQIFHVHVERAKRILAETDLAMDAVADRSGFAWQSTFSEVFRRLQGMTPKEYRRRFRYGAAAQEARH